MADELVCWERGYRPVVAEAGAADSLAAFELRAASEVSYPPILG